MADSEEILALLREQDRIRNLRDGAEARPNPRDNPNEQGLKTNIAALAQILHQKDEVLVSKWNEARQRARESGVTQLDLSFAHIRARVALDGIDFSDVNLEGVILSGPDAVTDGGIELRNADFSRADLTHATFRHPELAGCCFAGVDLRKTKGIRANQLSGADLSGAILPAHLSISTDFLEKSLRQINYIFYTVLLLSSFILLSISSLSDEVFFKDYLEVKLPIIGLNTQLTIFSKWPLALLVVLHLWLLSFVDIVCEQYRGFPLVFEDGKYVWQKTYPAFLNDYVANKLDGKKQKEPLFSRTRRYFFGGFVWLFIPFVSILVWWYLLKAQDEVSFFHLLVFIFVSCVSIYHYEYLKFVLDFGHTDKSRFPLRNFWRNAWFYIVMLLLLSSSYITYQVERYHPGGNFFQEKFRIDIRNMRLSPNEQIAYKPNQQLHYLMAKDAKLAGWNFSNAHVENGVFSDALLMGADFRDAKLAQTQFDYADLTDANLKKADLIGANLYHAIFVKADLTDANLLGARLEYTNLSEAVLDGAYLESATFLPRSKEKDSGRYYLKGTSFVKTDFTATYLIAIDFSAAKTLEEVIYDHAYLERANFSNQLILKSSFQNATAPFAIFRNADLSHSNIYSANFCCADFSNADLDGIQEWQTANFRNANICDVKNAPIGFYEWAVDQGAVALNEKDWAKFKAYCENFVSCRNISELINELLFKHSLLFLGVFW